MSLELNLIFMVSHLLSAGLNPLMLKNTFLASCQSYSCYCSITLTKRERILVVVYVFIIFNKNSRKLLRPTIH